MQTHCITLSPIEKVLW